MRSRCAGAAGAPRSPGGVLDVLGGPRDAPPRRKPLSRWGAPSLPRPAAGRCSCTAGARPAPGSDCGSGSRSACCSGPGPGPGARPGSAPSRPRGSALRPARTCPPARDSAPGARPRRPPLCPPRARPRVGARARARALGAAESLHAPGERGSRTPLPRPTPLPAVLGPSARVCPCPSSIPVSIN